jgi:putative spermidine/putrescine transport system ATP-binding protein/spermidine/putrescine transport system ATP-binding protein
VFVTHDQEEALTLSDRVAVMRNGIIEQVGAPREIYDRPVSEFVAGFLGASNFLDGTVISRGAGIAQVETACGPVSVVTESAAVGAKVRLAVRPERVRMNGPEGEGVSARIRDIVYRGSVTHYYMNSAGGPLLSYRQNAAAGDWTVGDDVRCAWDVESGVLVAPELA